MVLFFSSYHTGLGDQGDTQGYRTGKYCLFPATGESRVFRECSAPYIVTPEEGGLHIRSFGTGIASQITRIESRIIMD